MAVLDLWSTDDPPHGLYLGVGLGGRSFAWHVGPDGVAVARLITAGQARQAARDYVTTAARPGGVLWAPVDARGTA